MSVAEFWVLESKEAWWWGSAKCKTEADDVPAVVNLILRCFQTISYRWYRFQHARRNLLQRLNRQLDLGNLNIAVKCAVSNIVAAFGEGIGTRREYINQPGRAIIQTDFVLGIRTRNTRWLKWCDRISHSLQERGETIVDAGDEGHAFNEGHLNGTIPSCGDKFTLIGNWVALSRHPHIFVELSRTHIPTDNSDRIKVVLRRRFPAIEHNLGGLNMLNIHSTRPRLSPPKSVRKRKQIAFLSSRNGKCSPPFVCLYRLLEVGTRKALRLHWMWTRRELWTRRSGSDGVSDVIDVHGSHGSVISSERVSESKLFRSPARGGEKMRTWGRIGACTGKPRNTVENEH